MTILFIIGLILVVRFSMKCTDEMFKGSSDEKFAKWLNGDSDRMF